MQFHRVNPGHQDEQRNSVEFRRRCWIDASDSVAATKLLSEDHARREEKPGKATFPILRDPSAFVGHRKLKRTLQGLPDPRQFIQNQRLEMNVQFGTGSFEIGVGKIGAA